MKHPLILSLLLLSSTCPAFSAHARQVAAGDGYGRQAREVRTKNTIDLIDKVPVANIPIGWNEINSIDSLAHSFDYEHPKGIDSLCTFEIDTLNEYGLNHIFGYDTLAILNQSNRYALTEPKKVVFAKRLPNIAQQRVLIYYVEMQKKESEISLPCWLLVKVDKDETLKGYIIAGVDWGENDSFSQTLYYISENYTLYTRSYTNYSEEIADDEGNLIDVVTKNEDYIYASPVVAINLVTDKVVNQEP